MFPAIALSTATFDFDAIDSPKLLQQGQPHKPLIPHPPHVAHSLRQNLSPETRSPPRVPISEHSQVCALLRCLPAKSSTVPLPEPSHFHGFFLVLLPTSTDRLFLVFLSSHTSPFLHLHRPFLSPDPFSYLHKLPFFLSDPFRPLYQRLLPASHHFWPLPKTLFYPNLTLPSFLTVRTTLLVPPALAGSVERSSLCTRGPRRSPAAGPAGCSSVSSSPGPRPGWSPLSPRFTGCSFPPPSACLQPPACTFRCAHRS